MHSNLASGKVASHLGRMFGLTTVKVPPLRNTRWCCCTCTFGDGGHRGSKWIGANVSSYIGGDVYVNANKVKTKVDILFTVKTHFCKLTMTPLAP